MCRDRPVQERDLIYEEVARKEEHIEVWSPSIARE